MTDGRRRLTAGCLCIGLLAALAACSERARHASPASEARLVRQTYLSSATDLERDYWLYLPRSYGEDTAKLWPVLLFLHGGGERGDGKGDLDHVLKLGPLYEAWIQRRDLPFLIVAPQLPMFGRENVDRYLRDRDPADLSRRLDAGVPERPAEFETRGPMTGEPAQPALPYGATGMPAGWPRCEDDLIRILDATLADYRADPERVYLSGVSYGAFGAWYLASKHPDRFAALAPVVGWGHPDLMPSLASRQMPIWAFAGGRDRVVPVQFFYPGLNALERLGHRDVRFTVHEEMGHDVWSRVYAGDDLYNWLLSQPSGPAAD